VVFLRHVCFTLHQSHRLGAPIRLLSIVSIAGRYGVDLLFVLSGMLCLNEAETRAICGRQAINCAMATWL
jgi:hypothetical protein